MHVIDLIRNKLKWKLMIVISALILFVVTIIGTVSYWQTSRTIKRDVQRLSNQVLKQANLNLERYFKGYSQGFLLISLSPDLEKWLQVEKENMLDSVLYYQKINDVYVQPFLYQYPEILSLTLYNTNGNEISRTFRNGFKRNYKFTESGLDAFLNDNYTVDVRWSRDYLDYKGDEVEIPVITMVKKLRYGQHTGYLKIDIDLDPALRIVNELEIGDKGYGFISDSAGRIIAHPDESLITARMPEELIAGMGNRANGSWKIRMSSCSFGRWILPTGGRSSSSLITNLPAASTLSGSLRPSWRPRRCFAPSCSPSAFPPPSRNELQGLEKLLKIRPGENST
ncbi:cache domain-containing protein [Paenibacillus sp. 32O-W]|uniref:cache domain-containing protein n=1 Tax=Paenibacillus sp. 32O-W TaxID=1695218 RepID=UPI000722C9E6|nr:cache domain-containing protein [Paenibacillus sp. 32O-W]ALS29916.1 cache domain-containing protein [Paenibacillus sp. 32O-W]